MTRCGCTSDGDPAVFGPCRACHPRPEVDLFATLVGAIDRARKARREDFTLSPPAISEPVERPFEQTLDEDERHGR